MKLRSKFSGKTRTCFGDAASGADRKYVCVCFFSCTKPNIEERRVCEPTSYYHDLTIVSNYFIYYTPRKACERVEVRRRQLKSVLTHVTHPKFVEQSLFVLSTAKRYACSC